MKLAALYTTRYLPHIKRVLKPKTVAEYERLADTLVIPEWGAKLVAEITMLAVEDWHATVPGAVQANRALALLSGMLRYAIKRRLPGAPAVNPCHGIARNKEVGREFFYPPEDTQRIMAAAAAWGDIRAVYLVLELLTGCRPNELLESGPTWRHGAVLRTLDGKTGARTVYLPPAACAILDGLTPVLRKNHKGKVSEHYFPAGMDLRRAWDRLCRDAGVTRARMYDLRHTFASAALAAEVPLDVVGLMLGHRKRQTVLRYAHLAPDVGLQSAAAAAVRMGGSLR
jgi:integrase